MTTPLNQTSRKNFQVWVICAFIAMALRLWVSTLGHNYDMASWMVASEAILNGENPYSTYRYNYAPGSAILLSLVRYLQLLFYPGPEVSMVGDVLAEEAALPFHIAIVVFLGLVDVVISYLLFRHFHLIPALLFLLHPAIILLTGFHSQLENLGLVFLLLAVVMLQKGSRYFIWATLFMTLSLQMKHVAVFFPIWCLFRKELSWNQRFIFCAVPFGVFGGSFIPFLMDPEAKAALMKLTFTHSSFHGSAFFPQFVDTFLPTQMIDMVGAKIGFSKAFKLFFFAIVLGSGFLLRKMPLLLLPIYYSAIFTVFASGIADQYLMIPMLYAVVFWRNPFTLVFSFIVTIIMLSSHYNVGGLPEMLEVNRLVRGLGWLRWHALGWLFIDLVWRFYEFYRAKGEETPLMRQTALSTHSVIELRHSS